MYCPVTLDGIKAVLSIRPKNLLQLLKKLIRVSKSPHTDGYKSALYLVHLLMMLEISKDRDNKLVPFTIEGFALRQLKLSKEIKVQSNWRFAWTLLKNFI